MEKQGVPMHQYPQSPDLANQPPVYQDPNQQPQYTGQNPTYQQPQQPQATYAAATPPAQQVPGQATSPVPQGAAPEYKQGGAAPDYMGARGNAQPGMPPQQPAGQQYNNATPIASLNRGPAPADCPACGQRSMTNVSFETGNFTHAVALGLCCVICLGCIPYCMNATKDVSHKCGKCGVLLATWHRSGTTEVHIHS